MTDLLKSFRFREEREESWKAFEDILLRAEKKGVKALSNEDMAALPRLYRQCVSSLSVARSISLDQNLVAYLESLVTRGYFFVYGPRTRLMERIASFFAYDWPNAVRNAKWATLFSAICLFGGALLAYFLVLQDPDWYWSISGHGDFRNPDASVERLREALYDGGDIDADELGAFSGQLFNNNAQISIFAFALGFMFAIPTALLIIYNGMHIGAFVAVYASKGLGFNVTGWLIIHGATELFAIVLAGTAGTLIGMAVVFPGQQSRLDSARKAGTQAAQIAIGCVVMMFIAAFIEAYLRQWITSDAIRYTIGLSSLAAWLLYFYLPRERRVP